MVIDRDIVRRLNALFELHPELNVDEMKNMCTQATMIIIGKPMISLEELSNQLTVNLLTTAKVHRLIMAVLNKGVFH
jgi:hypothetical protein